jgi:hypothetical protein
MFVDIYSPPQTARNSIIRSTIVVGYMFIPCNIQIISIDIE